MPGQSSVSRGRRESPARPVHSDCDTFSQCRLLYSFRCVSLLILELQVRRESGANIGRWEPLPPSQTCSTRLGPTSHCHQQLQYSSLKSHVSTFYCHNPHSIYLLLTGVCLAFPLVLSSQAVKVGHRCSVQGRQETGLSDQFSAGRLGA